LHADTKNFAYRQKKITNFFCLWEKKLEHLNIPYTYQVVFDEGVDFEKDGVRVISASKFLTGVI